MKWYSFVVVSKVLNSEHVPEKNHHVTVAPYYEGLGLVPHGMGSHPCWIPLAETMNFDPRVVQFVCHRDAVRSHIEACLRQLSPGCTINWPDLSTSDSGKVEICFSRAGSGVSGTTVTKSCRDRVSELLGMIEVGKVDVLQEIWPKFVEQWQQQFPQPNESVLVEIDADKYCVHVVGEQQKCGEAMSKLNELHASLVEEVQRSKRRISERVPITHRRQILLLQSCGLLRTASADDLKVVVGDDQDHILLEGQSDKVNDRRIKALQTLALAHHQSVDVEDYLLAVLKKEPFRQHLNQLMENISGVVWYTAGEKMEVYGESQDKVSHLVLMNKTVQFL